MSSRITNAMMVARFNRNLYTNNAKMMKYEDQLATNRKIVRISDDPIGVIKSVNARAKLSDLEQYQKNTEDAKSWLEQTETALREINELCKRGQELATKAASNILEREDSQAIADEIAQLRSHVVTVMNSSLGDKYIFGGFNVTKSPVVEEVIQPDPELYDIAEEYDPVTGLGLPGTSVEGEPSRNPYPEEELWERHVYFNGIDMIDPSYSGHTIEDLLEQNTHLDFQIGASVYMEVNTPGVTVMGHGDDNIYKVLDDFVHALYDPDVYNDSMGSVEDGMQNFIKRFQNVQQAVLAQMADVGGRNNRLDMVLERYSQDEINYTQMKSDVEDLDQAEAIMWFQMAESVYRAALAVGGRTIQPTLMDFLR